MQDSGSRKVSDPIQLPTAPPIHSALMAIATPQFSLMTAFYQRLLGQEPQPFQANRYAEFQLPGLCLALFLPQPDQEPEFAQPEASPVSVCLKLTDLEAAIAQIKTIEQELIVDCRMGEVAIASHGQELYIYDPQGNRIILYQPLQFA